MSAERANKLLDDYAENRTQGCDVTIAIVPLPCGGALDPDERLATVRQTLRRLKLSPQAMIVRLLGIVDIALLGARLGTWFTIFLAEKLVLPKTTTYASPLPGPTQHATIGGVGIDALYGGAAPFSLGTGFTFITYKGELLVCCVTDKETVPAPQVLVDHVHDALMAYCDADGQQQTAAA